MLVAQLGSSSRSAWPLLVAYVFVGIAFGALAIALRDVIAGAFCVVAVVGAIRVGRVVWRRTRWRAEGAEVVAARSGTVAAQGRLFVGFGRHIVGAWSQPGLVLIGPTCAAFVPTGTRTHLVLEMIVAVFVARFRYVDLELYVSMGGDLDAALAGAVQKHGGFLVDQSWSYTPSQRWLSRPGEAGLVWIERAPPQHLSARWPETRRRPPAEIRAYRNRVVKVMVAIMTALVLIGSVAWRWAGEVDYLIAGLGYALLLGLTLVAVLVGLERQIRRSAASPPGSPLGSPPGSPAGSPPDLPRV